MTYDKEQSHTEIREAIAAWVLDKTLPKPEIERQICGQFICNDNSSINIFFDYCDIASFRLKPKHQPMIRVNCILCPAHETVAPAIRDTYFTANNAITRSKAMLVYEVVV